MTHLIPLAISLGLAALIMSVNFGVRARRVHKSGLALRGNLFQNRSAAIVFCVLNALTLMVLVRSVFMGNYEHVLHCLLALLLFTIPALVERSLRIQLPNALAIIVFLFIYAAWILGEVSNYYGKVPGWDTGLHTLNGFMAAAIGFAMVDLLNRSERKSVQLSPGYLALMAFCFSMTIGVLWEFVEFGVDSLVGLDMQKDTVVSAVSSIALNPTGENVPVKLADITSTVVTTAQGQTVTIPGYLDIGLLDTMKDLLVNFLGAVVFSVIGFFYVRRKGKGGGFAAHFIPVVLPEGEAAGEGSEREG